MSWLKYITKSKHERRSDEFSRAVSNGAKIIFKTNKSDDFVSRNSWWLYKFPLATLITCFCILLLSDILMERFNLINIVVYVLIGLSWAVCLFCIHYFITTRLFLSPERHEWYTYCIFWIVVFLLTWFTRGYYFR